MIHCRWSLSRAAEEVWLRWSDDGGESWRALASGLTGETACVPRGPLPGGRVLLQAVAHDGFHSQESEPVEVTLPARPPGLPFSILGRARCWCLARRSGFGAPRPG